MKITKRQLRRIIKEERQRLLEDKEILDALVDTWSKVRLDAPPGLTPEEQGEEAAAELFTYHPEVTDRWDALSLDQQDDLIRQAFGG
jgi:hypothetical protein